MPPLNCWIIEDEPPAMRRLIKLIELVRPDTVITFQSDSVRETLKAIRQLPAPDLIFSDIQLSDGRAFDIWESAVTTAPIIFTTAYDQYSIQAFRVNSIDYLLKPIEETDLERALNKAEQLRSSQIGVDYARLSTLLLRQSPVYRERFLAHYRQEWVPLQVDSISQIFSSDGLSFALTKDNQRYLLDESLERIEAELDPKYWFRINRAQIIQVESVQKVSAYFNHRIVLELLPEGELDNIVSRKRVKDCKDWLKG